MADSRWMVMLEGKQLDGDYGTDQVREIVGKNRGKPMLVWTQGMAQWADPAALPEFRPAPAAAPPPRPAPAPSPSGPSGPAFPHVTKKDVKAQAGVLKGLIDFRFQNFITTRMIPILYGVVLVLIALGAVAYILIGGGGSIINGIRFKSGMFVLIGLGTIVLTPILSIVYLALVRMWFETVIVFFRIKDNLDELVKNQSKKETPQS